MKRRTDENRKVTLTLGQLKKLVKESAINGGTGNDIYDKVYAKLDSIKQQLHDVIFDAQGYKYSNGFINKVNKCIDMLQSAQHEAMSLYELRESADVDMDKDVWEGWTVGDFIHELEPQLDMIMTGGSWKQPFKTKRELQDWCKDNQPYYKKNIPGVVKYFAQKYNLK